MEHGSRTRLVTAVVLAVVFGAGLLVGLAAERGLVAQPAEDVVAENDQADRNGERRNRRTRMYEQVGPTEAQGVLIDSVVKEHRQRMSALHDEFDSAYNPRYRALIQETREAILGVFTPAQAAEYQALLDSFDRRRAERDRKDDRG